MNNGMGKIGCCLEISTGVRVPGHPQNFIKTNAMTKSEDFNAGWWNCLVSFAAELLRCDRHGAARIIKTVMKEAGVTDDELVGVLAKSNEIGMPEQVYDCLDNMYLD